MNGLRPLYVIDPVNCSIGTSAENLDRKEMVGHSDQIKWDVIVTVVEKVPCF